MLLLGCNDERNILGTVAELARGSTQRADVHINDAAVESLARTVLLLQLCETLRPSSADDMNLLAAVWYSPSLTDAQHARLLGELRQLVRRGLSPRFEADDALRHSLAAVWGRWRNCSTNISVLRDAQT